MKIIKDHRTNKISFYKDGKRIHPDIKNNIAFYKGEYKII